VLVAFSPLALSPRDANRGYVPGGGVACFRQGFFPWLRLRGVSHRPNMAVKGTRRFKAVLQVCFLSGVGGFS